MFWFKKIIYLWVKIYPEPCSTFFMKFRHSSSRSQFFPLLTKDRQWSESFSVKFSVIAFENKSLILSLLGFTNVNVFLYFSIFFLFQSSGITIFLATVNQKFKKKTKFDLKTTYRTNSDTFSLGEDFFCIFYQFLNPTSEFLPHKTYFHKLIEEQLKLSKNKRSNSLQTHPLQWPPQKDNRRSFLHNSDPNNPNLIATPSLCHFLKN